MVGNCRCDGNGCRRGHECCATRREGRRRCFSQGVCYGCTGGIGRAKADNKHRKASEKSSKEEAAAKQEAERENKEAVRANNKRGRVFHEELTARRVVWVPPGVESDDEVQVWEAAQISITGPHHTVFLDGTKLGLWCITEAQTPK